MSHNAQLIKNGVKSGNFIASRNAHLKRSNPKQDTKLGKKKDKKRAKKD